MLNQNKIYTLGDLIDQMYNLEFKFYGNNQNGKLELFVKTDDDKLSVFSSLNDGMSKNDYLKLTEEEARKLEFVFDRKVDEMNLDIVAVVLQTSDVNIPSGKYSLETLDKLTKEQDKEERIKQEEFVDGISYLIVDHNTACNLYDGVYVFDKHNKGFIEDLKDKFDKENNKLLKNNLKLILDYVDEVKNKNAVSL